MKIDLTKDELREISRALDARYDHFIEGSPKQKERAERIWELVNKIDRVRIGGNRE